MYYQRLHCIQQMGLTSQQVHCVFLPLKRITSGEPIWPYLQNNQTQANDETSLQCHSDVIYIT